jgi:lambda family phage tail tape measure protein
LTFGAQIIDRYIGIWLGAYRAIVAAFNGLPDAFKDIFTRALNGAIALVEAGVNKIIGALNTLTEFVGDGTIGSVALGRIENSAAGSAQRLGETVKEGFLSGFNQDAVKGALDGVLNRADEIAKQRITDEESRKGELDSARNQFGQSGTAKLSALGGGAGSSPNFAELLQELQREGELLKLNNSEREIQQGVLQLESQLKRQLTTNERALVGEQLRMNQALGDQVSLYEEITGPADDYGRKVSALNELLVQGRIGLDQYNQKLQDVRTSYLDTQTDLASGLERAFLKINKNLGDAAKGIEEVVNNAFKNAEDALVNFVKTGKLDFRGLVDSILQDLIRLTIRQGILAPIAGALGGIGGSASGGIGGALVSGIGSLFGFANGGDFNVGGAGGVDSQLVAFRATPGEQVIVNKPNNDVQQKDSANGRQTINFYISTPDVESFKQSESQIAARASRLVGRGRRNL